MEPEKKKVEDYKLYLFTFTILSMLTLLAVWLTHIRFAPPLAVVLIMVIAALQAVIVLLYNMHLKFQDKILTLFVGLIFSLMLLLILVTTLDFIDR